MEKRVKDLIAEINSFTSEGGFSVKFIALTAENVVKLRLEGPEVAAAQATMKSVIEQMAKTYMPEISGLEFV
ncbi:MAG TPA: NifU family protein [Candidatus Oscillibacter excrementigallinarum]|uniref:NifU family protein n=1 Tax=Candidatus Oscillibacter excrementigallinarum TaxID=2838716 RepID=A0A9D2RQW7_9FIRM|nr:NifU family protein [Candidatus Oscillibacter excrementigallinarum]